MIEVSTQVNLNRPNCTHRAPVDGVQAEARVCFYVRDRALRVQVVVDKDVLAALRVCEDALTAGREDVAMRGEHQGTTVVAHVHACLIDEGAVRRRGSPNKDLRSSAMSGAVRWR